MVGGGWGGRAGPVEVQASVDTNAILQAINNGTLQTIQGQNGTNLTVERSAASTFNGITQQNTQNLLASVQGFAGLNNQVQQGTNQIANAICAQSYEQQRIAYEAQLRAQECCCETNLNIERPVNVMYVGFHQFKITIAPNSISQSDLDRMHVYVSDNSDFAGEFVSKFLGLEPAQPVESRESISPWPPTIDQSVLHAKPQTPEPQAQHQPQTVVKPEQKGEVK